METSLNSTGPLVVERSYNAPVNKVWEALTELEKLKQWYFDLAEFKPEVGFEFEFIAGDDKMQYRHLCRITEVIPFKKIAYTWRYDGFPGDSKVSFEIAEEGAGSRVTITHTGLETFPDTPGFARSNFNGGWTYFIDKLKEFAEKG